MTTDDQFLADLHRIADRVHASETDATAPPPNTWQRVLAEVANDIHKNASNTAGRLSMNTHTTQPMTPVTAISTFDEEQGSKIGSSFGRLANIAAAIALVLAVAVGGWLAMSQVPGGDRPEPRLAVLGLQEDEAGNGVCDVEPLSVDEAISILRDPMAYLSADYPEELDNKLIDESRQGNYLFLSPPEWDMVNEMMSYGSANVVQSEFDELLPFANEYLDCLWNGTRGQVYRLQDPISVQYSLTMELPVLVSEEEARVQLDKLFSMESGKTETNPNPELHAQVSENADDTVYIAANLMVHNSGFYVVPVQYADEQGDIVLKTDLTGAKQIGDDWTGYPQYNLVIGKSSLDGNWYVIGIYSPEYYPVTLPSS